MAAPLLPGDPRQLGAFYLDGRLGAGGQGVVYEGYGPGGERVAVKALHGVSARDRDLLRREVSAWRKVAPFCTTKVLHADVDGPVPFVVSEYVAGPDLRQAVGGPEGRYGPERLRRLAIGLATALVAIHRAGVVHRDVKPENILLGPDGPRVIDFGIAGVEELSTTGAVKGTLRYMPPERYRGLRGDAKVDVWGWGAVILFAATGRAVFDGETVPAIADQVATHEPDTSVLDEPLRPLVAAALSKDPADRPTSEDLLLGLAGGVNLAEAAGKAVPAQAPAHAERSRAELAEAVFAALAPAAQEAVPRVFLRLVASGERAEDTLRSARRGEFADDQTGVYAVERVLSDYTGAGILVWEGESVTLAGAALIRAWPRLRAWVEAERAGLGVHQDLVGASRLWDGHGRKNSDLYQGTALARAHSWAATGRRQLTLNLVERAFLDSAAMLTRRRGRFRALLSAVLTVLLVIAVGAAAIAVDQRQTVAAQRDRAASAQIAGLAMSLRRTDPDLARRLAVAAWSISGTTEAWSALLTARHQWENKAVKLTGSEVYVSDLDGTGRTMVTASGTQVGLWHVGTGRRLASYTAPSSVDRLDISEDGRTVALRTARDQQTVVLDAPGLRLRNGHRYPAAGDIDEGELELSPTGAYLAVSGPGGDEKGVAVWDTRTGRRVFEQATGEFLRPSFSPQENLLSLSGQDEVSWIDLTTGGRPAVPDLHREGLALAPVRFSPDGVWAVRQNDHGGRLVSVGKGPDLDLKGSPDNPMAEMRFSPDGRYVISGFTVWEVTGIGDGKPIIRYPITSDECAGRSIRFSANDSELRCVSPDGVLHSLDVAHFTRPAIAADHGYSRTAASHDGSTLALAYGDKVEIWSTAPLAKRFELPVPDTSLDEVGLKLSRDGRLLALGHGEIDDEIEIWDLTKRSKLGIMPKSVPPTSTQGSDFAQGLDFSPDNRALVLRRVERGTAMLKYWDLSTMKVIRQMRAGPASVEFHPDGKTVLATPEPGLLAFPSGKVVKAGPKNLWQSRFSADGRTLFQDTEGNSSRILTFDAQSMRPKGDGLRIGPLPGGGGPPPIAHSSDDRLIATPHGNGDATQIKLWDLQTRAQVGIVLTGHLDFVVAMTFTPDDSALISVGQDGRFVRYTIAPRLLADELCAKAGALTEAEWKTRIPDVAYRRTC
ncbi:WD40 repeat domain-containing serine/threonine protein kinase [Actinomadura xylanilytica]|uniref:WD40 repeat domain-containing serine/threonine protein kinase n=1 Tax=Actinomadura xylanilytica TaxID=887459 RepID=UPI00255A7473|nr:WD40 repeat domain-containing serine/threonine protein kinase [Actinomadura xylanilytica]MDL4772986.1 WD40 repeat domain-containing serine/threonine protein kinase [Actinomadura xylanilytica]